MHPSPWTPDSWRTKPIKQDVQFPNEAELARVLNKIASLPPLVARNEVDLLRERLAEVAAGRRFLLHGGDCAERFDDCTPQNLESLMKVVLQMSLVIIHGARIPVVRIGRVAGQYAKPRSSPFEPNPAGGEPVLSYRGDNVNGQAIHERVPDPQRLLQGHLTSAATLNYIRILQTSGFADLHNAQWDISHVVDSNLKADYQDIVSRLLDAFDFMRVIGAEDSKSVSSVEWFTSHEGLMLELEQCLTGADGYNLGAHYLWCGDRTRQLDGAHVEFFRGLRNPIGVKAGPGMDPQELVRLLSVLDPEDEPGKVSIITRFGHAKVRELLPPIIEAVQRSGRKGVVWVCDPMHGNTTTHDSTPPRKTRNFAHIVSEFQATFEVHREMGTFCGGVHLEMTGLPVTECVGGSMELRELDSNYTTACDPRLNGTQALDMAFMIAKLHKQREAGLPRG
ncbi:phospho-2-dehydro-3-deoxyheptonate aldolase [Hyaloraphidium curvatum]|nr:phospho-2-dehydro-3-deoxyheptonate aldolase [Hyaloraphidium curvatum]